MPAISVLIPAYNAEKYIARCLDSIMAQTFSDIEIIVVNDASTDGTAAILEEYAPKDSRIRIVNHPENRGTLWARLTGISFATGSYISYVDSDDEMEPEACAKLYSAAVDNGADFVVADHRSIGMKGNIMPFHNELKYGDSSYGLALSMAKEEVCICPWSKLFKRELFTEHPVEPVRRINIADDVLLCFHAARFVKKAVVVAEPLYRYHQVPTSVMHTPLNDMIINADMYVRKKVAGFCEEIEGRPDGVIKRTVETRLIRIVFNWIKKSGDRRKIMDKASFYDLGGLFTFKSLLRHLGPWKAVTFYLATHTDFYTELLYRRRRK